MKSKLVIVLLGCLIFVLGGITGIVSHCLYSDHFKTADKESGRSATPGFMDVMALELNLDAQQKELLENILEESRLRYRELNRQFRPQYDTIRNETDDTIRNMLRDDQKERFEEVLGKYRQKDTSAK